MATDIEIFIGTSLDFLLSYRVNKTDGDEHSLRRYIAHRCHNGAISCMATKGRYLATGGADDRIVVVDLKLNRDVHEIVRHDGSINSLLFTNKGNDLLSGSDDGRLVATTVGSWQPINTWKKPHTGKAVLKVCIHPSDKFALTLGKDGTLRGWDMFKGTQINTLNTKDLSDANIVLDDVELSPDGSKFAMSGAKTVTIMSLTGEEPYDELTLKSRVTSMCWLDSHNLLIGLENGCIEWLNMKASEQTNIPNIHTNRIKGMHCLNGFLGTVCSTGTISLWHTTIPKMKLTLICTTTDSHIRPTCIKLIDITENRRKEKCNDDTEMLKESLPRRVKKAQPISTTGKVIVETDGKENGEIATDQLQQLNFEQEITDDDTDTEVVIAPKKSVKRKKPTNQPLVDVVSDFTVIGKTENAKKPKRKKSTVTSSDTASTIPPNDIEMDHSSVKKRRETLPMSIDSSKQVKVTKKKKAAVLPVDDVVSTTSIETEHSKGTKRKAEKMTVSKPIVVRSPNSDDDFEQPKKKRLQTKKKYVRKAVAEPVAEKVAEPAEPVAVKSSKKEKLQKTNLSVDSPDVPAVRGRKKKLNLSLTALDNTTPIRKEKIKATTPISCPVILRNHNSKRQKQKRQKLEFDTTK